MRGEKCGIKANMGEELIGKVWYKKSNKIKPIPNSNVVGDTKWERSWTRGEVKFTIGWW
jgi:hypothetical protein